MQRQSPNGCQGVCCALSIRCMADLLTLSAHLPVVGLEQGAYLVRDGERTGSIWILEEGSLEILKAGVLINTISRAGTAFGEIAAVLGSNHSASVRAAAPCRLRYAQDGRGFLLGNPDVLLLVTAGLAERLDLVTGYLADLRNQYADAPGVTMVAEVLGSLVGSQAGTVRSGSLRDPDPEY